MTLYRMLEGTTLETALTKARRESSERYSSRSLSIEGRAARLVSGATQSKAKWSSDVKALTGENVVLQNESPGAALLIQVTDDAIWALTWGTGFHFLDTEQIDFGFGAGIVARSALPAEVKSLTKTILDHRARVDRSSMPNGSTIRDLGVDGYGEVVSRIEAKASIPELAAGDRTIQLRAADSLNLPLAKSPAGLVADLKALDELSHKSVLPGLESLEQLIALKPRDSRVPALEAKLVEALHKRDTRRLGVSWPHERLDSYGPASSVRIVGVGDGQHRVLEHVPDVDYFVDLLTAVDPDLMADRVKKIKIELHGDADPDGGSTLVAAPVALRRWLAFEVEEGSQRYCLHDGSWYRMDDRYLARIDDRVREILAEPASVPLPDWGDEPEKDYNEHAAEKLSGYSMDRKLISTPLHSRGGIEPCDVFIPPGTLIHVKRGRRSSDLSHLIAQGLVSADALARDENARTAWRERVKEESSGAIDDAELNEVILAIGSTRPITVDTLFTFTKVNLVKQVDALRFLDVHVAVATIRSPESTP